MQIFQFPTTLSQVGKRLDNVEHKKKSRKSVFKLETYWSTFGGLAETIILVDILR